MTKRCALCLAPITASNSTREHILPNAIGGRRRTRDFICKRCNSETGSAWDSELARQFQLFCVMFDVSRQRGGNQAVLVKTLSGRKLKCNPDGLLIDASPRFETQVQDGRTHVSIRARSHGELKKMLRDLSDDHPNLNVQRLLLDATMTEERLDEPLQLSHRFGGHLAGRSAVKSCLALACESGLSSEDCPHAIEYLVSDGNACFGYYNETDPVVDRPERTPLHCVHVCANPETGLVLSYVEYFGFQKIVACLSSNYSGPAREGSYAINPLTGEELNLKIELDLRREDIAAVCDNERFDEDRRIGDLKECICVWSIRNKERVIGTAMDEAIVDACTQLELDSDEVIPKEKLPEFVDLLSRRMADLMLRLRTERALSPAELRAMAGVRT